MNSIFKNVPEAFVGLIYFVCGSIILLDSLGAIHAGLLVMVGAFFLMWHGFVMMQGPKKVGIMIDRLQNKKD